MLIYVNVDFMLYFDVFWWCGKSLSKYNLLLVSHRKSYTDGFRTCCCFCFSWDSGELRFQFVQLWKWIYAVWHGCFQFKCIGGGPLGTINPRWQLSHLVGGYWYNQFTDATYIHIIHGSNRTLWEISYDITTACDCGCRAAGQEGLQAAWLPGDEGWLVIDPRIPSPLLTFCRWDLQWTALDFFEIFWNWLTVVCS